MCPLCLRVYMRRWPGEGVYANQSGIFDPVFCVMESVICLVTQHPVFRDTCLGYYDIIH